MAYEGLSEEVRAACIERMARTLSKKPRHKKTLEYRQSIRGRAAMSYEEAKARLWEEALAAAKTVVEKAQRGDVEQTYIRRARKSRISPFAHPSRRNNRAKNCRRASRFQPHLSSGKARESRDMEETRKNRVDLYAAQGGRCALCSERLDSDPHKSSLDHLVPFAMGGVHGMGNYVLCHRQCNADKSNDVPTGCEMVWLLLVNAKLGLKPDIF